MAIIDLILILAFLVVTYTVAGDGFFGAAVVLLAVIFSGLAAMNFFEPLAEFLEAVVSASPAWSSRWDVIAFVGLFAGGVVLCRTAADRLVRDYVHVHPLAEDIGRWGCGALAGYVTIAFLLTALHTAPLPREFLGFRPERRNLLEVAAPDRQWLGFTQYVSEHVFPRTAWVPDGEGGFVRAKRVFDGAYRRIPGQPVEYWPSFPMRYAHRRATLESPAGPGDPAGFTPHAPDDSTGPGRPDF